MALQQGHGPTAPRDGIADWWLTRHRRPKWHRTVRQRTARHHTAQHLTGRNPRVRYLIAQRRAGRWIGGLSAVGVVAPAATASVAAVRAAAIAAASSTTLRTAWHRAARRRTAAATIMLIWTMLTAVMVGFMITVMSGKQCWVSAKTGDRCRWQRWMMWR